MTYISCMLYAGACYGCHEVGYDVASVMFGAGTVFILFHKEPRK